MQNLGRYLITNKKYEEAYGHYKYMAAHLPNDPNALINLGILAQKLGHNEEALNAWTKATQVAPSHPYAHLYLADELYDENKILEALPHYEIFLNVYTHIRIGNEEGGIYSKSPAGESSDPQTSSMVAPSTERVSVALLKAADGQLLRGQTQLAMGYLQEAALLAQQIHAAVQENVAQAKLAVLYDATGRLHDAMLTYRRALILRGDVGDPQAEARDWRDYGDFLFRHGAPIKYGYACLIKAEQVLQAVPVPVEKPQVYPGQMNVRPTVSDPNIHKDISPDLSKYTAERIAAEKNLGVAVSGVRQNLDSTLTEAVTLPYEMILPQGKEVITKIEANQAPDAPAKSH